MGLATVSRPAVRAWSLHAEVPVDENSREYREMKAAELEALTASRMAAAAGQDLSAEEISALETASKTLEPAWEGKLVECPPALKNALGTGSVDYFGQLRS